LSHKLEVGNGVVLLHFNHWLTVLIESYNDTCTLLKTCSKLFLEATH